MLTRDEFLKHLRDALSNLYDAQRLRQNPLAQVFGVANRFDTYLSLRRTLTEAIESLKPPPAEPPQSRAWRIYNALFSCYVQQLGQQVVADQLAISTRQLRREQSTALEVLADRLWLELNLESRMQEEAPERAAEERPRAGNGALSPTAREELAWLQESPVDRTSDAGKTLVEVEELARPLAAHHEVDLGISVTEPLPRLVVHPVALTQALLNLLSVALPHSPGGEVRVRARPHRWEVEITVEGHSPREASPLSSDDRVSLSMARQLAEISGGRLELQEQEGTKAFRGRLYFPALEQLPVLVIDDNADTLQLLQRYTSSTRYRLIATQNPEEALQLAAEHGPQLIVLDVMMPQVDGWRVLAQLRQHPQTRDLPIIVCTILAQEALALSLGANRLLRKPLSRQAFLAALDRQLEATERGPR